MVWKFLFIFVEWFVGRFIIKIRNKNMDKFDLIVVGSGFGGYVVVICVL